MDNDDTSQGAKGGSILRAVGEMAAGMQELLIVEGLAMWRLKKVSKAWLWCKSGMGSA